MPGIITVREGRFPVENRLEIRQLRLLATSAAAFAALTETLLKLVNTTSRIDETLLSCKEGMTV